MNRSKKALVSNILLLIMEVVGVVVMFVQSGYVDLKYYTNWSNILGLISAVLFLICYINKERNKVLNDALKYFKLTSTICLTVTILVVVFMFVPMDNFNFYRWVIRDNFFSFHLISPIIAFITFMFFEKYDYEYIKDTIIGLVFTIIYSVVVCILILLKKISAPYPFLDLYAHSVIVNIINLTLLLLAIIGLTLLFIFIKRKNKNMVE